MDDLHTLVEERLRRVGQRYTGGRRSIVAFLARAGGPVNISAITDDLPEVPRSSAYRHLVDLESAGLVRRLAASDEYARFELSEDLTSHHHHLLCTGCGRVVDVTPSSAFEVAVETQIASAAREHGFSIHGHRLDVLGICQECELRQQAESGA